MLTVISPPDNGSSEYFIILEDSPHLDSAYGGYCVFAQVAPNDVASWDVIAKIATTIAKKQAPKVVVNDIRVVE